MGGLPCELGNRAQACLKGRLHLSFGPLELGKYGPSVASQPCLCVQPPWFKHVSCADNKTHVCGGGMCESTSVNICLDSWSHPLHPGTEQFTPRFPHAVPLYSDSLPPWQPLICPRPYSPRPYSCAFPHCDVCDGLLSLGTKLLRFIHLVVYQ